MRRPTLIHVTTVDLSLRVLLSYQLRRFAEEGFDVYGASAPGPYVEQLAAEGIRHLPVNHLSRSWSPIKDARALRELRNLFAVLRPDIVHTHNPKSGVLGRVAARRARVPAVVNTVHGLYAGPQLPAAKRWIADRAERSAARYSDHELFQSEQDYEFAVRTHMVPASRATLLGNGVELRRFDPSAVSPVAIAELRAGWGAEDGIKVVGTVGRLVKEKGYSEFFECARIIRERRDDVTFVAVGPQEPSKSDRLSQEDLEHARRAGVVIHGEGRDMPAIQAAFDIFVLASHREGVPRSAIEASAMGKPVVTTNIRGAREVVVDGVTGVLVPPRESQALARVVGKLVEDEALSRRLGEAGRERAAERFDEDQVIERTLSVYRGLLAEKGIL
ncbi:MAG: glycosyltransferase family 4 protein [Actinomycetota bacterium]